MINTVYNIEQYWNISKDLIFNIAPNIKQYFVQFSLKYCKQCSTTLTYIVGNIEQFSINIVNNIAHYTARYCEVVKLQCQCEQYWAIFCTNLWQFCQYCWILYIYVNICEYLPILHVKLHRSGLQMMLDSDVAAVQVQRRSAAKAMQACHGATCSTRPDWSLFSYVNVYVLLQASWRDHDVAGMLNEDCWYCCYVMIFFVLGARCFWIDVEVKGEVDGSVSEDRVPSSTRIWRSEQAKKMNKSPCSEVPAAQWPSGNVAGKLPLLHRIFSVFSPWQWIT